MRQWTLLPCLRLFSSDDRLVLAGTRSNGLLLLTSQGEHADIGAVAVALGVIQAIADHEFVGDGEAHVVGTDSCNAAFGLVQQDSDAQAAGPALSEHAQQRPQGPACGPD